MAMLEAGKMATYTLTITGGAAVVGGFDVSTDNNGVQFVAGAGARVAAREVTHSSAKRFTNNTVSWDFTVVAPNAAGSIKLFAAGNSTNGSGTSAGDAAGTTTFSIEVMGGMMAMPDMAMAPADLAMAPADMAMAPAADMATAPGADMAVAPKADMAMKAMEPGGCSTTGGTGSALGALLALAPLALLFGRRRRK